jgi:hypothetical protein
VVGVYGLQWPAPHVEGNLGHWGREGHKKGENKPLCWPWEGIAENTPVTSFQVLQSNGL